MEIRKGRVSPYVRTEGGLLPADLLARITAGGAGTKGIPGLTESDYHLPDGVRFAEAITRGWNRLAALWLAFDDERSKADLGDPLTTLTRERWMLPLFEELGFGRPAPARAIEVDGATFPISHADRSLPVHIVGAGIPIDRRTPGVRGAAGAAPHSLVQELLDRDEERLWGFVGNGLVLRLLRDNGSLTRQAYLEFDLAGLFAGQSYADFALLWLVCHRSRFEGARPDEWLIERWTNVAAEEGTRALDTLRKGVQDAISVLGAGFLEHPVNGVLRDRLRAGPADGGLDRQDYYRQLLRLVYRLIFLFTAEDRRDETTDRELLLDPAAPEEAAARYRTHYSTARLRDLAMRKRGSRHTDLWIGLRRVMMALGSDQGAPTLALPPLGSFLFGTDACPDLDAAELRNIDLLEAIRALATIEEDRRLRPVDYRNLGSEELGSVYESLLELHPRVEMDATPPRFDLSTAAGHERKTTGSYYTPSTLIESLLDTALDPVLDEAVKSPDPEAAILRLAVVDPAAGSGHFLVAAAHRIARRLASVRSQEGAPPPSEVRRALRNVIGHCIYAVDINPMAVELCKVGLWLESLEPGRPLSFLDAHIKHGNSLLGTTPELVEAGVPDAAYEPITGDDQKVARSWRERNRRERQGQQTLFDVAIDLPVEALANAAAGLDALGEDNLAAVRAKERAHESLLGSSDHRRAKGAADAWCAAFVAPKTPGTSEITTTTVRALAADPGRVPAAIRSIVGDLAADYRFFHWQLEFPQVFARGGFDVVVGNPPWEHAELKEAEFFAERRPDIANARNAAARRRLIDRLRHEDPAEWGAFQAAQRTVDGENALYRLSGRFPLTARGRINTYAVFAEAMRAQVGPRGRTGMIVLSGIATDDNTKLFFTDLVQSRSLTTLYSFENEDKVFPGVHNELKFCLLTLCAPGEGPAEPDFLFFARDVRDIRDPARHFRLSESDFALFNPNTKTCPSFRSAHDAELAKAIYRRVPVLWREADADGNPWSLSFMQGLFNMATGSGSFLDEPGPGNVPLYEGKMVHQFDDRFGTYEGQTQAQANKGVLPRTTDAQKSDPNFVTRPRYWVARHAVEGRLEGRTQRDWLLGWRDVTNSVAVRTLIASVIPKAGAGDKVLLAFSPHRYFPLLLASLNSFVVDWASRQKFGGASLKYHVLRQLPVMPPDAYSVAPSWGREPLGAWLRPYVAELAYTSHPLRGFASDLGWNGPPFRWDPTRRAVLRAEVDAAFFHLYGVTRDEATHILDSFWIVRDQDVAQYGSYRTKDLVLDAYDRMAVATPERPFASALDPGPGSPEAAHPDPAGTTGTWRSWTDLAAPTATPSE